MSSVQRRIASVRRPWAVVGLLWLAWLLACSWVTAFRTPITTDLTVFLPQGAELLDAVLVQQLREGPGSRLLLIAIDGVPESDLASLSRRMSGLLKASSLFEAVSNGDDSETIQTLERHLFPYRYLLSPAVSADRFGTPQLRTELEARLADLSKPIGMLSKAWLAHDPTGEWQRLLGQWLAPTGPVVKRGVWFSADGQQALLVAQTRASGFDLAAQAAALDLVRRTFEGFDTPPTTHLAIGGAGSIGVEANERITRDAVRLSVVNSTLVMLLLFAVYRSLRVLGLTLLPLATGVLSGIAATSLVFGGIHGITLGFGATLVGVAADYPNHFFTHLSQRDSPAAAMARIWPTLRLGLFTNAAGFAGMLFSGFSGLAQLAVFAATGLLAAGLCTRWVLPVFAGPGIRLPVWVQHGSTWAFRRPVTAHCNRIPLLVLLSLMAAFAWRGTPLWNDDIAALNPASAQHLLANEALAQRFGAPDLRQLAMVVAPDAEAALHRSEAVADQLEELRRRGALASYEMAARFLPSREAQKRRLDALPDVQDLTVRLREAQRGLPFKSGLFQPFLDDIREAHRQGPIGLADIAGTPFAAKVTSLLFPLRNNWVALIPLAGLNDPAAVAHALEPFRSQGVHYVDLRQESTRLVRGYRQEAITLLGAGLGGIALILALGLRSTAAAAQTLIPVLAAGLCTALAMALLSGGLTLYHVVSLLLVLGLSLDQALFFNRDAADPEERRRTLLSLLVCSSSSVLAFGTLALSDVNVLNSIGATVALGAFIAITFAALLARRPRLLA